MGNFWERVKLPRVIYTCCGYTYDTLNINNQEYFRCFAHKKLNKTEIDKTGIVNPVKFCITIWLTCKNNNCITSFTFSYNPKNKLINRKEIKGIDYLLKLKDKFLSNIPLKVKVPKIEPKSKNYLWKYTDYNPNKNFVSNIYTLDDKKVGETEPQIPTVYYL